MNGIIDVKVGKVTHRLRFGYHACMEFERRVFKNASENLAKIFTDLVYSGLFGEAMRSEQPIPEYGMAYDLLEEMASLKDYDKLTTDIWETYYASKWGADFQKRLTDFAEQSKKKVKE